MNEATNIAYMVTGATVGFMIAVLYRMFKSAKSKKSIFNHHNHME